MRVRLFVLSLVLIFSGATSTANATRFQSSNAWIQVWTQRDQGIAPSLEAASRIFGVSYGLMDTIVGREGGNVSPATLRTNLCTGSQPGWNTQGSSAFGPFQFLLAFKAPCMQERSWGTFGSYDDAAFQDAKRRGWPVPYRFKTPASNVGQAITAAYMLANGGLHHWCASMC